LRAPAAQPEDAVAVACAEADASQGLTALFSTLATCLPGVDFNHVLTRAGWYRLGGVIASGQQRVTDNIRHWLEQSAGDDLDGFIEHHRGQGLIATRIQGQTHYLTAPIGPRPEDFIQLEVEELQEFTDRELLPEGWEPDNLEELLDPLERTALPPLTVGQPRFVFRRMQSVPDLLDAAGSRMAPVKRFMYDWAASSAAKSGRFSEYWVLALRETEGNDGDLYLSAKPVPVNPLPEAGLSPYSGHHGAALVEEIRRFDQAAGYPFAWFFAMLTSRAVPFEVGEAVMADLAADYDYLPPRDALILSAWSNKRYAV
jgi:hypothetical protein